MTELSKGFEIEDRFVLTERLGRGGNGEVWKATDKNAKRDVAIKVLIDPGENETQRLLHEAQKWAALEHENILRLYDIRLEEGMLVMECAEGGSLEEMIRASVLRQGFGVARPPCTPTEASRIFTDILRGLAFAHEKKIMHGDLKPGNVLLTNYGTAKITDFGMAREEREGDFVLSSGLDCTGMSGTPEYMSPEQARHEDVDLQSDIFSAGIIAYQLYTGRHPFFHASLAFSPREIIRSDEISSPDITRAAPEVPERVAAIVNRMMQKEKHQRYATVRDILVAMSDDAATVACTDCGHVNPVANRFCGQCGASVGGGSGPGRTAAPGQEETADEAVNKGFELARQGGWTEAIKKYRRALEVDSSHQRARANLGYALNHLGLYEEALGELTQALEHGEHPALYSYRAFAHKNLRQYADAIEDLDRALRDRPRDASLLKEKAYCLLEEGDIEKAYLTVLEGLRHDHANERLLALRRKLEESSPEIRRIVGR